MGCSNREYDFQSKNTHISDIDEVEGNTSKLLENIGRYPLLCPIPFTTSYDKEDEHWFLCNDELALFGYGSTYSKAIEALEEELESHIISYTEYSDEEHATDSLIMKEKLRHYVNFEEIKKMLNVKYGDI